MDKKRKSEFVNKVRLVVGGEYRGSGEYMKCKHALCGSEYEVTPRNFLKGFGRCKQCKDSIKALEYRKQIQEKYNGCYELPEKIRKRKDKIKVKHTECGDTFDTTILQMIQTSIPCPRCSREHNRRVNTKSHEKFLADFREVGGREYVLLSRYKNTNEKVKVRHENCSTEYEIRPDSFLRGAKCRVCTHNRYSRENTKTTEEYAKEVDEVTEGEYELIGDYVSVNERVVIRHETCSNTYKVFPYLFQRGRRCPFCSKSKGELLVQRVLDKRGVKYEIQKTFSGLVNVKQLSYDFYLPKFNALVEYQGKQHYEPVELFGGEPQFARQKEHDKIKREYAKSNNYMLLEIPYTIDTDVGVEKEIEKIIGCRNVESPTPKSRIMI